LEACNLSKQQGVVVGRKASVAFFARPAKSENFVDESVVGRAEDVEKCRIVCMNMPVAKKGRTLAHNVTAEQKAACGAQKVGST